MSEKGITFSYGDGVLEVVIAEKAFGNKSGARDLRRVIRKEVEDGICNLLIADPDSTPAAVSVESENGTLSLHTTG